MERGLTRVLSAVMKMKVTHNVTQLYEEVLVAGEVRSDDESQRKLSKGTTSGR